jgi:hypothetical protein
MGEMANERGPGSPYLAAAGAAWEEGPNAGEWIARRLGPFGPSVGHAVPNDYPAYAIVEIPWGAESDVPDPALTFDALFDVLEAFTGDQVVHCGIWPGFGFMYATGDDPRTAQGMGVSVAWSPAEPRPPQEEIDRQLAAAREDMAGRRVECPDAEPLRLPHREYYLWSGPLRSAMAFRHMSESPPSLIWPDDRSWFAGTPIYSNEIAVAGSSELIDAVLRDDRLSTRRATPADDLDIDD